MKAKRCPACLEINGDNVKECWKCKRDLKHLAATEEITDISFRLERDLQAKLDKALAENESLREELAKYKDPEWHDPWGGT